MLKRKKIWMAVSAITLAGTTSVTMTACDSHDSETSINPETAPLSQSAVHHDMHDAHSRYTDGESHEGEHGEGESSEGESGEGEYHTNFANNDIAYLAQLAFMRGHLYVGYELYKADHLDHAKMHMKHPKSELYMDVAPAFVIRGSQGFDKELTALAQSVENNMAGDVVDAAYANLVKAITENEASVDDSSLLPDARLKLVSEILRVAGDEYAIAVVDGKMQNAHEYQDAYGFTVIAKKITESITSEQKNVQEAKQSALAVIDSLSAHWPSLMPPETLETEAKAMYGAAAKIELLSLSINND